MATTQQHTTRAARHRDGSSGSIAGAAGHAEQHTSSFELQFASLDAARRDALVRAVRIAANRDDALEPVIHALLGGPDDRVHAVANAFRDNDHLRAEWEGMYAFLRRQL